MAAQPQDLPLHIELVAMKRRHLRSVLKIETQVYPRPWSLGLFLQEIALKGSRTYVVAKVGPTVVGYAGVMYIAGDGHVTTIAVDPDWHRQGIGTRLLLALHRAGVAHECTGFTLEVRVSNQAAQAMYRRFGYAPAGIRKNYYAESNEDALVMWAHDVDLPAHAQRLNEIEGELGGTTAVEEGMYW